MWVATVLRQPQEGMLAMLQKIKMFEEVPNIVCS
jgi:hypothetical protein